MEWPIDFGVTEFCDACKKCANHCASGAIYKKERSYEVGSISSNGGALKWVFDAEKCQKYKMDIGSNCGICIRVCPFNKSGHWLHSIARWFIGNVSILNGFWIKMDNFFVR